MRNTIYEIVENTLSATVSGDINRIHTVFRPGQIRLLHGLHPTTDLRTRLSIL